MKKSRLIFVSIALFTIGIVLTTTGADVSAHTRAVKVPASLRGTWYHYDGSYSKIRATKYHFKTSGSNGRSSFSGVKFPKYASGHADMFVHRTPKGYYNLGKYGTDDVGTFKKVTHKGHAAIKQVWHDLPDTGANVNYWYKTKRIARHPSPKYKTFHGYRIASQKKVKENTYYIPKEHAVMSFYRPGQKSKVIFEYGTHVYPTKHAWKWMHGEYLTTYKYHNGTWHKISTDYAGAQ